MSTESKQTPYGVEPIKGGEKKEDCLGVRFPIYSSMRNDHSMSTLTRTTVLGDESRHRDLHGQYRHSTPTMHSPRASMPRINMGKCEWKRDQDKTNPLFFDIHRLSFSLGSHEDYSLGLCGYILLILSYALICLTFPFSLTVCLKVDNENFLYGKKTQMIE